jgi:hypothetical protein
MAWSRLPHLVLACDHRWNAALTIPVVQREAHSDPMGEPAGPNRFYVAYSHISHCPLRVRLPYRRTNQRKQSHRSLGGPARVLSTDK